MSVPRKIRCQVESVTDHGGRVYTVDLAPSGPVPAFQPGQFLHLTVEPYDPSSFWPESRVFSIASSPRDRRRLRICYAVKGRYTTRMEQTLKPGIEVWTKLPFGDFVIDAADDAVLLAGGTGISAFTAFLEALAPDSPRHVTLVYGARAPELLLFKEEILDRLARVPRFRTLWFTESGAFLPAGAVAALPNAPRWFAGPISLDCIWPQLATPAANVFYLSGPPAMLAALSAGLAARGVPPAQIRADAW
jgi:ferredoxin-NADP reductase